jgi:hypothetical protein
MAVLGVVVCVIAWCCLYFWLGVWPPDIFSGKVSILASAKSNSGAQFRVVQFFNGYESYTTQLEQINVEGATDVVVIDGDAFKYWSCSIDVIENDEKLVVSFPSSGRKLEYYWRTKKLVPLAERTAN